MQDNQQYEQLMLQYEQLKNGSEDIFKMIDEEDYDGAIGMMKIREPIFLNCKCMRKYLELNPEQIKRIDNIIEEIKTLEERNINILSQRLEDVKVELKKTQKTEKIQNAYDYDENNKGSIVNIQE